MLDLQRLACFVAVVEAGSFTAAAQTLGQSKAVVSFTIKQLEKQLGVSLLTRSTRRLELTEVGEHFYPHCLQLLQQAENVLHSVRNHHQSLTGILRITSTHEYGTRVVIPALAAFAEIHPQLRIQHESSSYHADLIAERFDVAIRLGQLSDSNHHAALIDSFAIFPVATPEYLARLPGQNITSLEQLAQANWIAHSRLNQPLHWQVNGPEGKMVSFKVQSNANITADSADALLAFALAGSGVALLPEWQVKSTIQQGRLVHLLADHYFPQQSIYALYPQTRHVSQKVRAFIDFLRQWVISASSC